MPTVIENKKHFKKEIFVLGSCFRITKTHTQKQTLLKFMLVEQVGTFATTHFASSVRKQGGAEGLWLVLIHGDIRTETKSVLNTF